MCDPVSLGIMLGTKAVSTYASNRAAKAVDKKRKNVIGDTEKAMEGYSATARQDYNKSLDASTPEGMAAAIEAARLDRGAAYEGAVDAPVNVVSDNADSAAKNAIATALAGALATSKVRARNRAGFEAYGAGADQRNRVLDRSRGGIATQNDFAQGRRRVGELQLAAADQAGRKWANIAGLADAVGTVAGGAYGMSQNPMAMADIKDFFGSGNAVAGIAGRANPALAGTTYFLD